MKVFQQTNLALGSEVVLTISTKQKRPDVQNMFDYLWTKINNFDKKYSRFRWDSDITNLNEQAGEIVSIDTDFQKLLLTVRKMADDTEALFNPFILPALTRIGYQTSWAPNESTSDPPIYNDRVVVTPNQIIIKDKTVQIPANSAIDIGGIGKGYLLDQLSDYIEGQSITDYWFSLGGDIIARGSDPNGKPWKINIANAKEPNHTKAYVCTSSDQAIVIATSGVTKRHGIHKGKNWHHIVDSATAESAKTDILTCTVIMNSGVLADVYASCIVALGSKKYDNFIKRHTIKNLMIQTNSEDIMIGKGFILA